MFTQTRIALALVVAFAVAGAHTALAGGKQHDKMQGNSTTQHDDAAAAKNGQPHPADLPAQAETTPGQPGTSAGEPGVAPGDQRQEQQSKPADMTGPTADDATARSDAKASDGASGTDASATPEDALGGDQPGASGSSDSSR